MPYFSQQILRFYRSLTPPANLPRGFTVLHPQKEKEVMRVMNAFYKRFYHDEGKRVLLLGINPGRFGAGATGINFTAPRQLVRHCGISHALKDQSELSAEFIYEMIDAYGGPEHFFGDFYIGAVSPFGFMARGVNCNYYDSPALLKAVSPFIVDSMQKLLRTNVHKGICICVGEGKNFSCMEKWNHKHAWFREILPLAHPRFILQYRRKNKDAYIHQYVQTLRKVRNDLIS